MTYSWPLWLKIGSVIAFFAIMAGLKILLNSSFQFGTAFGVTFCLGFAALCVLIAWRIDRRGGSQEDA